MKLKITSFLVFICLGVSCCIGKDSTKAITNIPMAWNTPDSTVFSQLGKRLTDILMSPQKVTCYTIEIQDTLSDKQLEPYFTKGKEIAKLSREETAIIQHCLISNPKSYQNDSIMLLSPYIPCLLFEFSKKKETAKVLVSLSDYTWTVHFDGKKQFNYNYHSEDANRLFKFYTSKIKNEHQ